MKITNILTITYNNNHSKALKYIYNSCPYSKKNYDWQMYTTDDVKEVKTHEKAIICIYTNILIKRSRKLKRTRVIPDEFEDFNVS